MKSSPQCVHPRLSLAVAALAVSLAAVLPYISSAGDYFLADDFGLVHLFSNKPTFHVLSILLAPWTESIYGIAPDELRPTLALAYQFDSLWGANNPVGYHLSNIAFHLICSLLVLCIAWRVAGLTALPATFAAMLFAVLPIHPETVVWISGRADSIPAMFYLSAVLGFAVWRRTGAPLAYGAAVIAFAFNLFSKQSAITLPIILVVFDLLVERRPPRRSVAWLLPYVPFVGLTLGFLGLRLALFGNAVREQSLTANTLIEFASRQATYVKLLFLGSAHVATDGVTPEIALLGRVAVWVLIVLALCAALVEGWRVVRGTASLWWPRLLFFGPVWWLVCIAPLVVTYQSPRHLYLPSAGVAVAVGILLSMALGKSRLRQAVAAVAAAALVVGSTQMLARAIGPWREAALVSQRIATDLERELAAAPAGSVLVLGTPQFGPSLEYHSWLWMWAMPFAARSPFVPGDLGARVSFVVPPDVYCCPRDQWHASTLHAIAEWSAMSSERAPVIVLRWDGYTGDLEKQTDLEVPGLRYELETIGATDNPRAACDVLLRLLPRHVGSC